MLKIFILSCLVILSPLLKAQSVTLYTQLIPGLFQTDKQGVYDQVIQLSTPSAYPLIHKVLPNNRAFREFQECQNCCYSPSNLNSNFYNFSENIKSTKAINTAKAFIFSHHTSRPYNKLNQLKGKTVGLERGMNYGKAVENGNFRPSITNSLLQNFNMLKIERIDAVIAYAPDIYQAFKEIDKTFFQFDIKQPIAVHEDALVCRGVEQRFIQDFNKGLEKLKKSGQLKVILGELYVAP